MKNILVLEGQTVEEYSRLFRVIKQFKRKRKSVVVLERVYHKDKKIILHELDKCDTILFDTTWLHQDQIAKLALILSKVNSKNIICLAEGVLHHLEDILDLEELALLSKHNLYNWYDFHYRGRLALYKRDKVDMLQFKVKWDKQEKERIEKNHSFKSTGRKVVIKQITAFGNQWNSLKQGDIVNELDCSSIDPCFGSGIWVMGKDEPVKLLIRDGYNEFEFEKEGAVELAIKFACKVPGEKSLEYMNEVCLAINQSNFSLWDSNRISEYIATLYGLDEIHAYRFYRNDLDKYMAKHKHFSEFNRGRDTKLINYGS